MPLELLNTFFVGATFVVITLTAVAALVQIRHLRASNQLSTMVALLQLWEGPELQRHYQYTIRELPKKLADPTFFDAITVGPLSRTEHPELLVADFWEQIGTYMKYGYLDENSWLDISSTAIWRAWDLLEPAIEARRKRSSIAAWENFEYAAVRARLWDAAHPDGNYPKDLPRMAELRKRLSRA